LPRQVEHLTANRPHREAGRAFDLELSRPATGSDDCRLSGVSAVVRFDMQIAAMPFDSAGAAAVKELRAKTTRRREQRLCQFEGVDVTVRADEKSAGDFGPQLRLEHARSLRVEYVEC